MTISRRRFLNAAAGSAAMPALSRGAWAQAYPSRPVRVLVGFAPGGPTDIAGRMMAQFLLTRTGAQFIVENRTGASGNIAAEAVAAAPPDGYTVLHMAANYAINATLFERQNFKLLRDVAPVASIMRVPNIMVVHPSVPAATIAEFIAYAKANPGKVNFASGGIGTSQHVSGELFALLAGITLTHVPYRGSGPAFADMIGGHVQVMFDAASSSIGYIRAGQVRALGVTSPDRLDVLPQVPAIGEVVAGYEAVGWHGWSAPARTPADIIDRLNGEINIGLTDPTVKARIADLGGSVLSGTPADFGKLLAAETEKWGKVIRAANIKPE